MRKFVFLSLHNRSNDSVRFLSGIEFIAIAPGKPESEHSIQHGGHDRNQ